MAGFTLPDTPEFDDWQYFTNEELRQTFANVLETLVHWHTQQREYSAALTYARRWLALDSLHESVHRTLM